MIQFRHLDLDRAEAEFQGHKIEVRKNTGQNWDVWVNGNLTKPKNFATRKAAISYVYKIVDKIVTRQVKPVLFSATHQGSSKTEDDSLQYPRSNEV